MIALYIALIPFLFTNITHADCNIFTDVTSVGHHAAVQNDKLDVPLFRQKQQISRAKTCHAGSASSNCRADECQVRAAGNIASYAMTNLTHLRSEDVAAAELRILKLALGQVEWPKYDFPKLNSLYTFGENRPRGTIECIRPGDTGVIYYAPEFACVAGTLQDCGDNGTTIEQDGNRVKVCMPIQAPNSGPVGTIINSIIPLSEAKGMRINPALKVKNPVLENPELEVKNPTVKPNGAGGFLVSKRTKAKSLALFVGLTVFFI